MKCSTKKNKINSHLNPAPQKNDESSSEKPFPSTTFSLWDCLDENLKKKPKTTSASSRAIIEVQRYLKDDVLDRQSNTLEW